MPVIRISTIKMTNPARNARIVPLPIIPRMMLERLTGVTRYPSMIPISRSLIRAMPPPIMVVMKIAMTMTPTPKNWMYLISP